MYVIWVYIGIIFLFYILLVQSQEGAGLSVCGRGEDPSSVVWFRSDVTEGHVGMAACLGRNTAAGSD